MRRRANNRQLDRSVGRQQQVRPAVEAPVLEEMPDKEPETWPIAAGHIRRVLVGSGLTILARDGFGPVLTLASPRSLDEQMRKMGKDAKKRATIDGLIQNFPLGEAFETPFFNIGLDTSSTRIKPKHPVLGKVAEVELITPPYYVDITTHVFLPRELETAAAAQSHELSATPRVIIPIADDVELDDVRYAAETSPVTMYLDAVSVRHTPAFGEAQLQASGAVTHTWPMDERMLFQGLYRLT